MNDPTWLDEAYSSPVVLQDVGLVSRNLSCADTMALSIEQCGLGERLFLDYGAGHGLLVRLMRY
jgi:hypothetical protein